MTVTRKKIDNRLELKILTGMIVSDRFLQMIILMVKPEYFQSGFVRTVVQWCCDYYNLYKEAPKTSIMDIYDNYRRNTQGLTDMELVKEFLTNLSNQYENMDGNFPVDLTLDRAKVYLNERKIKMLMDDVELNIANGRVLEAAEVVSSFNKIDNVNVEGNKPFEDKLVLWNALEADEESLFTMPGPLGEMLGPFKREYLVATAAPMKKGKSTCMLDIALQAYYSRLNVAFFSLEMSENQLVNKMARTITGLPKVEGEYLFPVWDCILNQLGECNKSGLSNTIVAERVVKGRKSKGVQKKEEIRFPIKGYSPCTKCDEFPPTTWLEVRKLPKLTYEEAWEQFNSVGKILSSQFRLVCWPAFTVGLQEVKNCLSIWENMEGFVPDVIVVDYADILKPDQRQNEERHNLDKIWKGLKSLAQSTRSLVVTATQTNRSTLDKESVGQGDIAEDIRKLAHVDIMFGISQTPEEKKWGLARIGVLGQRHEDFNVLSQCYILQQLDCGQFCLDSKFKKF